MNYAWFEKIAKYLAASPLVVVGFVLMLVFGISSKLIDSGLIPPSPPGSSFEIITLMLRYSFQLGLCVTVLGFALTAWSKYIEKAPPVDAVKLAEKLLAPLQGELAAKNEQINALTEAITALSKADAPASSINAALQSLERGNTEQAKAIFAEVLKIKEAEGRTANKEVAAAARHLGALAFMNNPKEALTAYQKAVELDPDNAEGWNQLGTLLRRTGQLAQAEAAYRKVLALGETKEWQAKAIGNLGIVYFTRGDLVQAEEMHKKALSLNEALDSKEGMAVGYANLGAVYEKLGELGKAEELWKKSLEISEALGLKEATANQYGNLGIVYKTRGDLAQAEEMFKKALALHEALGSKEGIAADYANLGALCEKRGELGKAEELWKKSLRLFQEIEHPDAKKLQQWLDALPRQS